FSPPPGQVEIFVVGEQIFIETTDGLDVPARKKRAAAAPRKNLFWRGGIDSKWRSEKPGTHCAAVGVSGAGDYDNHLPDDPACRAGHARTRSREPSRRAPR